jgi:serine/threonine protein kinase
MGIVHLAREGEVGRLVAIKSPLVTGAEGVRFVEDTSARRFFTREATAWMELGGHPNIVHAFDVKEVQYLPRIFMEYCDGGSLKALLKQHPGGLPWQQVYDLTVQICWAIAFAHERGLVHRDLKPANILLLSSGSAKVSDFGLVRPIGQKDTKVEALAALHQRIPDLFVSRAASSLSSGEAVGTPLYMPPEQWNGHASPESDLYALGLILFELCTGRHAFDLATHPYCQEMRIDPQKIDPVVLPHVFAKLHSEHEPLDPARLRSDIPSALCELLQRCLAKHPKDRPSGAVEVAEQLASALRDRSVDIHSRSRPGELVVAEEAKRNQAWALIRLGTGAKVRGDLKDAEQSYNRASSLFVEIHDQEGLSSCYMNLGNVHLARDEYDRAVVMYQKALPIMDEISDRESVSRCYMNLGNVHRERGEYDRAVAMYEKALAIKQEIGDRESISSCYMNLGIVHDERGEYDQAVAMYQEALAIKQEIGDKEGISNCYANLGIIYRERGDHDQAATMCLRALTIKQEIGDRKGISACYANLGVAYELQGQIRDALTMYRNAQRLLSELSLPHQDWLESKIRELERRARP